jgi:carboxyl-terminal processing protease
MKRTLEFVGLTLFFTLCLGGTFLAGYYARALSDTQPLLRWPLPGLTATDTQFPIFNEARDRIETNFIGALPGPAQLDYGVVRGYVNALGDPYTVFVEPPQTELEAQTLSGEYGGIGVEISRNAQNEIALNPFPESPAAAAGLREGDVLLQVDEIFMTSATTNDQVAALVRGPVGTTVTIRVRQADGQEATFTLTRQKIEIPSVTWRMVDGQPDIGLLALSRFSDKTAAELDRAARELQTRGATRYVVDLRNNGGGLLNSAVEVAGLFLDGGVVMYETSRNDPEKTYTAPPANGPLRNASVAVLVNANTASAAEILAGALLDRERAPLIGQTTFGKGSVQYVFELSDGSSVHVTANLWYTPARRQLDKVGLPPTIEVEPASDGRDAELARAVEYLRNGN